jgi:hypothetical protein
MVKLNRMDVARVQMASHQLDGRWLSSAGWRCFKSPIGDSSLIADVRE